MTSTRSSGTVEDLPLDVLLLDWENPRLPPEMQSESMGQRQLALFINKHYDPLQIAESIAEHEYFLSEPLIAIKEASEYRVIEGNRRLTALKGLADEELRAAFAAENRGWAALQNHSVPATVPVLVVTNRSAVAPLLGFRHISGIEPWDPYAQARYIARLVSDGHSLDSIADLVGRPPTEVRSMFRDLDVLEQAEKIFEIDTRRARSSFGVFNNAMGRVAIRAFIDAPAPRLVDPEKWPLPESAGPALDELLIFIFGRWPRGDGRVVTDSRQLGTLAKILAEPSGRALAVLRETRDLTEATDALADPDQQFVRAVSAAVRQLEKARLVATESAPRQTLDAIDRISQIAGELRRAVGRGDG